jgi:ribonucleoside-diphosphate reductase alpha chain
MTKANAIYRDGSKLSQPLNAAAFEDLGLMDDFDEMPQTEKSLKSLKKIVEKLSTRSFSKKATSK